MIFAFARPVTLFRLDFQFNWESASPQMGSLLPESLRNCAFESGPGSMTRTGGSILPKSNGVRCSMFDVRCSVFDVRCSMFDVRCSMFDVRCSMLDVGCWMLDVGCWMLDVGCWAGLHAAPECRTHSLWNGRPAIDRRVVFILRDWVVVFVLFLYRSPTGRVPRRQRSFNSAITASMSCTPLPPS
jgi:hypothetical protein